MKYIKIVLFTAIVMILVLFAVRNQGKVNFVLGYKTTFTRGAEVKEDVKKDMEIKEEAGADEEAPVGEVTPGEETGVVTSPLDTAEPSGTEAATETGTTPKTIGYEREYEIPLFLLVFIEAFVLIVLMSLVGIFEDISMRNKIRELTKENKKIKSELNILKKGEKGTEKVKTAKAEEEAAVPVAKQTVEKKPEKAKKETKKKRSLLKSIKGDKTTPAKEKAEDKGL